MIRIIENGKYRVITCECGCKYSFDSSDLNEKNKIACPECGKENSATIQPKAQNN